jgi:hypothetical protein
MILSLFDKKLGYTNPCYVQPDEPDIRLDVDIFDHIIQYDERKQRWFLLLTRFDEEISTICKRCLDYDVDDEGRFRDNDVAIIFILKYLPCTEPRWIILT